MIATVARRKLHRDIQNDNYHSDSVSYCFSNLLQRRLFQKSLMQDFVNQLDIADGLKQLLISRDISLKDLLHISYSELGEYLDIDDFVARLIIFAIKNKIKSYNNLNYHQ
jgi:hypothetical protein